MPAEESPPGWFGRNWKWVVPVFGIGLPLAMCWGISFAMGIYLQPKLDALGEKVTQRVQTDPVIAERLGGEVKLLERVQVGYKDSFLDSNSALVDFSVRVVGPVGRGRVAGNGRDTGEGYEISQIALHIDGTPRPFELEVATAPPPPESVAVPIPVDAIGIRRPEAAPAPAPAPVIAAPPEPVKEAIKAPAKKAAPSGTLTLVTRPSSEVYLGGQRLGVTPIFKLPMKVGTHRLTLVGEDGMRRSLSVPIEPNKLTQLNLPLADL